MARHNQRCKRCGEFVGKGLYKMISHKCRTKKPIPKLTRAFLEDTMKKMFTEKEPKKIHLTTSLKGYSTMKKIWDNLMKTQKE